MKGSTLELKVGIFIFIGFLILFLIIFSIRDITIFKPFYRLKLFLNFASGIGPTAPVRLVGVSIGEVEKIFIFYDDTLKRSRAELILRIDKETRLEADAVATINTLGLLGEKYVEITPGTKNDFLKENDILIGKDPITMEAVTEELKNLVTSISFIVDKIKRGEGTLGKLLIEEKLYNDFESVMDKVNKGEGTIGRFLKDESIYNNLEEFTADIKAHPWKLFHKPR